MVSLNADKKSVKEANPDPLAPMITWKDFQSLMPWEIVILVGGGYALAAGCKVKYSDPVPFSLQQMIGMVRFTDLHWCTFIKVHEGAFALIKKA